MVARLTIVVLAAFLISNARGCGDNDEGVSGFAENGLEVCCIADCADGCQLAGCERSDLGEGCCPSDIVAARIYCDDGERDAPCIIGASSPAPTVMLTPLPAAMPSPTMAPDSGNTDRGTDRAEGSSGEDDDTAGDEVGGDAGDDATNNEGQSDADNDSLDSESSSAVLLVVVVLLAVLLAALIVGITAWCFMCRRKLPQTSSSERRDSGALVELGQARKDLATERNRRARAEALVQRAKGGGIRPSDFPSVRDVFQNVDQLADDALTWTEKACAIGGVNTALPMTLQSILENTFAVCREEVKRCLDGRLQSLSDFLGNDEPVLLSGGDAMNLDTQYVMYECLCRNYETIVPVEPDDMRRLASAIVERSQGPQALVDSIVHGDAWHSFEDLMENYMTVFVEMALQKPRMDFESNLGQEVAFTPVIYRDWAPHCNTTVGQQCRIVFPALLTQEGRPKPDAKVGVVRLAS